MYSLTYTLLLRGGLCFHGLSISTFEPSENLYVAAHDGR